MKKHRGAAAALCLVICIAILAGCWDKVEIEDRLFVLAMGFDKVSEEKKKKPTDKIDINFVSPIVAEAAKPGKGPAFKTYNAVGESLTEIMRDLLTESNKKQFFGHCKVIIFGQEILRDSELFKQVLDFLGRSHELHKSMYVFVTPGKAEDVFKVEPAFDRLLAPYIAGIADNSSYVTAIPKMTLADLLEKMESAKGSGMLPLLIPSKDSVEIDKMAIIKNYKVEAFTDEEESRAINRLNGKAQGGTVNFNYEGTTGTFRYYTFDRKISFDKVYGGKIYLDYKMETEGTLEGFKLGSTLLDEAILAKLEEAIEKEIKKGSEDTLKKVLFNYKVDLIGAGDYVKKHKPRLYNEVKDELETNFGDVVVINLDVDVKVRRVGTLK